ncbi:MAG: hypothetical protein ACKOEO_14460, partial [Planctomycetaceae bacterium]
MITAAAGKAKNINFVGLQLLPAESECYQRVLRQAGTVCRRCDQRSWGEGVEVTVVLPDLESED